MMFAILYFAINRDLFYFIVTLVMFVWWCLIGDG